MAVKADITIDIDKQVGNLQNLTNIYNARVGDNKTPLTVLWRKNGMALNLKGLHAFIAGKVGDGSYNAETDKVDFPVGTPVVKYEDDGSGTLDNGQSGLTTLLIPKQMWQKSGVFAGYIGLKSADGSVFTSKDIWFKVLGNVLDAGVEINYFIGDFDKALAEAKEKSNQLILDARNAYLNETKDAHDSLIAMQAEIDEGRGDATHLAGRVADMLTQIKDNDIVTIHDHQEDISKISTAINDRLKNMKTAPVGIADEQTLKNTYPNGTDGLFVTLDTKHLYMWLNGQWSDAGPYETAQLDKQVEQSIGDVKSAVLKENLIKNGSFSDGTLDGVTSTIGNDKLHIFNFLNRNWACLQSDTSDPHHGFNWQIDNPLKVLGQNYPFHIEFDIVTARPMTLNVSFLPMDHQNNRLGNMIIKTISTNQWEFKHFDVDFAIDDNFINADHFWFQITQSDAKPVQEIRITGLICYLKYHQISFNSGNLIKNGDFSTGSAYPFYSQLNNGYMHIIDFANHNWLDFSSAESKPYQGVEANIKNPISELGNNYPLKLKFKLATARNMTINVNFVGFNSKGERIGEPTGGQTIAQINTEKWRLTDQEISFEISDDYINADYFILQFLQNDSAPIEHLRLTDLDLRVIYDKQSERDNHGNLIENGDFSNKFVYSQVSSNTGDGKLRIFNFADHNWLSFVSSKVMPYQGLSWRCINPLQDLGKSYPLHVKFTLLTAEDMSLQADIIGYDAQGKKVGSILLSHFKTQKWRVATYEFTADPTTTNNLLNATQLYLQVLQPDGKPVQEIRITDIVFDVNYDKHTNLKINELEQQYGLPIMMISGDLSGMDHDHAKNITYDYKNKNTRLTGYGTIKWQGSSSAGLAKKGYRLKTTKSDYSEKDKIRVQPSWQKHHKFNLKAYYNDGLLSRDPIAANIGGQVSASRPTLPRDLIHEDNFGYIDGFPIILFINNEYQGIYSFNLTRPSFDYTKWAIIGNTYNDTTQFVKVPADGVKLDGSDFESLNPEDTPTDEEKKAVTDLFKWMVNSTDDEFKRDLDKHFNIPSLIDYVVVSNILGARDASGKNQVLMTWDGKIWYYQLYDLDCTYNANWMGGKTFDTPNVGVDLPFLGNNQFLRRFAKLYHNAIADRYRDVRQWCTPGYILNLYKQRINLIGQGNFEEEWAKWNDPSKDTEDFKQLQNDLYDHFKAADFVWLGNNPENTTYQIKPDTPPAP